MDFKVLLQDYVDRLVPRLDTYEQAIYVYLLRHTHLIGRTEATVGFKSARRKMGFGIGEKGKPMSEHTCYEKLKSLQKKDCVEIIDSTREGTTVRLKLPPEIYGLNSSLASPAELNIEEMDFFTVPQNRDAIIKREGGKCFYCLRTLNSSNHVIEHVSARASGGNGYRNVVAACRTCNNRKNDMPVKDFLRSLYREGILSAEDFAQRTRAIECLRTGGLKPILRDLRT